MTCTDYWVKSQQDSETEVKNLLGLVNDASRFVRYFGMAIARSAPHIYVSALPFAPSSSHIVKHWLHLFRQTLSLERGQLSHWPALEMTIQTHEGLVHSVAFSPNGHRIASASRDFTICVWDATTGEVVAGLFTGHTDSVFSVAFSPDGQRIASASRDCTIRVWDAATGEVVAGPFTGHTDSVNSVAFSPDGQRIASASLDRTIRVWDAAIGEVVAGPFTGHTDRVESVAFSQTEQHTLSPSGDCTIHVEVTTEDIHKIYFMDKSLINSDGWICGEEGQLLLWIPPIHRPCLHSPSTVWIAGEHETRLDLSNSVHGSNWATVYVHDLSK
jgi:WD40 repeat protein